MKSLLTLAAIAAVVSVQPVFALAVRTPDGGTTAFLALISVSGLVIGKNLLKKH